MIARFSRATPAWLCVVIALCASVAFGQMSPREQRAGLNRRDLLLRAARNQVRGLDYEKALEYYSTYLDEWPDEEKIVTESCGVLLLAGKVDDAAKKLELLVKKNPENLAAVGFLSDAYRMKKDFSAAAKVLEAAVARFKKNVRLREKLAEVYTWSTRYDEAIGQYRFLLEGNPGDVTIEKKILQVLYWAAKYDDYLAESARYLKGHPKDMSVRLTRVDLLAAKREFAAAARECRAILEMEPKNRVARARLARFLTWLRDYDAAVREYKIALAMAPEDLGLRRQYGQLLLWSERFDEAILTFRKLHADLPEDENIAREYLDACAGAVETPDQDRKWVTEYYESRFKAGKSLKPATLAALARALRNIERNSDALEVFAPAVKAAPDDLLLRLEYADLLSAEDRAEEAEKEFRILLKRVGKVKEQ